MYQRNLPGIVNRNQKGTERPKFLNEDQWNENGGHLLAAQKRTKKLDKPAVARTTPSPGQRKRAPSEETSSFAVTGTEAILGPSVKRDTTIHLQVDVEHDIESRLEEFSRLKRLGDFVGANKYFEANLQEFIHISPVSVELADMLLAQGAYKRLKELRMRNELNPPLNPDELISHKSESRSDDHFRSLSNTSYTRTQTSSMAKQPDSGVDRFDITFLLIEAASSMYSEGSLRRALRLAKPTILELNPNSTSLHSILLSLEILTYVREESKLVDGYSYSDIISDCSTIYQHLLEQDRLWEARDLLFAGIPAFGAERVWRQLLDANLHSADFLQGFLRDWLGDSYDPSSYLAILDVLVALSQYLLLTSTDLTRKTNVATVKRCLEKARDLADVIKAHDSEYIKSRSYIQCIIQEEKLSRELGDEGGRTMDGSRMSYQHFQKFPGLAIWMNSLPTYVPIGAENPGSRIPDFPESDNELLRVALQASEELGDYRTQVSCLQELIARTKESGQLLDKLMYLQRSVQGDMIGYLQTCISSYLYATTIESRQVLIDRLAEFDGHQVMSYSISNPLTLWLERKIQRALYLSMGLHYETEKAEYLASEYESHLPSDIQSSIHRLGLSKARLFSIKERVVERGIFDGTGRDRIRVQKTSHGAKPRTKEELAVGPKREPKRETSRERLRPTADKQSMVAGPIRTQDVRDSERSVEEISRKFPPPGLSSSRVGWSHDWAPVLSDSKGKAEYISNETEARGIVSREHVHGNRSSSSRAPRFPEKERETQISLVIKDDHGPRNYRLRKINDNRSNENDSNGDDSNGDDSNGDDSNRDDSAKDVSDKDKELVVTEVPDQLGKEDFGSRGPRRSETFPTSEDVPDSELP